MDSQEAAVEEGSKKQVVLEENGTQRNLTEDEQAQVDENEEMENFAADMLRDEEDRMREEFTSAELRQWEEWAAPRSRLEPCAKRARVQVIVQGEGGRIVRKENWLVGLRDGESLVYTVSVQPSVGEDEEEGDPAAASSNERVRDDVERGGASLPVTGLEAPDMWSGADTSRAHDLAVEDFLVTPLAEQFYQAWRSGQVTDSLIGHRFGYGVLGGFYGKKDWESGVFQDETAASGGTGELEGGCGGPAAVGEDAAVPGAVHAEGSSQPEYGGGNDDAGGADGDAAAASSVSAVPESSTESGRERAVGVGKLTCHVGCCKGNP